MTVFATFATSRSAVLFLSLLITGCAAPQRQSYPPLKRPPDTAPVKLEAPDPAVRVAILVDRPDVRIRAPREFVLTGFDLHPGTPEPEGGEKAREAVLTAGRIEGDVARLAPLSDQDEVYVNDKPYRGVLEIRVGQRAALTVVNEVPLETYLLGVLSGEVPKDWPLEALKAQAIAARTFAVLKRDEARARGQKWDLESTNLHQVYEGSGKIGGNIREAVERTRGVILTWGSKPIQAFFHSNCGGRTSRASNVWSSDLPYLKAVSCPYCAKGAHYHWQTEMPVDELVGKLRAAGHDLSDVTALKILDWDDSTRVRRIRITDADGGEQVLKGHAFRMAAGSDVVKSTRFEVSLRNGRAVFRGKGWGHGVGLCQEGAEGMARAGFNASEILRKYYPGVIKEKIGN